MKRLIVTESQLENLQTYLISEATDKDRGAVGEFVKEVKQKFVSTITNASVGDFVEFIFGLVDEANKWVPTSISKSVFEIMELDGENVKLKFVAEGGNENNLNRQAKIGDTFMLYPKGTVGIHFRNRAANVGFIPIIDDGKLGKLGTPIVIGEFITFIISPGGVKTNPEKLAEKAEGQWSEEIEKFNKTMYFEPGMFGMDNFFFFPKGYAAMDKILSKYGLGVGRSDNTKVRFMVLDSDIIGGPEKLNKNAKYLGVMDKDGKSFTRYGNDVDFVFFVDGQNIATGGTFKLSVSYKEGGRPLTPIAQGEGKANIKIINSAVKQGEKPTQTKIK